jgi:lysozyme
MYGIDISNHQGNFPVAQAVSEGYEFVIAKCSQGDWYEDPYYFTFVSQARAAGAIPGAYHWLEYGDGRGQARFFYSRVVQSGGPNGMLIVCDNESNADWNTTCEFFDEWAKLSGNHPMFMYTGAWWWNARGWSGASLTPLLWHSSYVSGSSTGSALYGLVPDGFWTPGYGGWNGATLLQYSSTGRVAGYSIDVNFFRGSRNELLSLTRTGASPGAMIGDSMDMSTTVPRTATPQHPADRSLGDFLSDLGNAILHGKTGGGDLMGVGEYADSPLAGRATAAQVAEVLTAVRAIQVSTGSLTSEQFAILRGDLAAAVEQAKRDMLHVIATVGTGLAALDDSQ